MNPSRLLVALGSPLNKHLNSTLNKHIEHTENKQRTDTRNIGFASIEGKKMKIMCAERPVVTKETVDDQ